MSKCFLGTELKLLVNIAPIDGKYMKDMDFDIAVYTTTPEKGVIAGVKDGKQYGDITRDPQAEDAAGYYVLVDTSKIGIGKVKCKVTAYVEDPAFGAAGDAHKGTRTEIDIANAGVEVVKAI